VAHGVSDWHRAANGSSIPVDLNVSASRFHDDAARLVVVRDLSQQLEHHARLTRLTHRDSLTGLFNRQVLPEHARAGLARAQRAGTLLAFCFVDLDGFKAVNDQLGHDAGDRLLQEVARRIKAQVRENDVVVRLGGDEFVILVGDLRVLSECEHALARVLRAIAEPVVLGQEVAHVTSSIGVAVYPLDGEEQQALLRAADQAMYRAKAAGRNQIVFHNAAHQRRSRARHALLDRVAKALQSDELTLAYEPVVCAVRGELHSVEATLRWRHPVLGLLTASEFLPFIGNPSLEQQVDLWTIARVASDASALVHNGIGLRVNLFAPVQSHAEIVDALRPLAQSLGRGRLTVELSSTSIDRLGVEQSAWMSAFRSLGIRNSLDGVSFGSDSLHTLAKLGLDELKLSSDALGLRDAASGDAALLAAYSGFAAALDMTVVVVDVRSAAQWEWLAQRGRVLLQGPSVSATVEAAHLPQLLSASPDNEQAGERARSRAGGQHG
jgi:diguanylate cyclase (GGDEF)-like protein